MVEAPNETKKFVENPEQYILNARTELKGKDSLLRQRLTNIQKLSKAYNGGEYINCVELARHMFDDIFHNQIA